MRLIRHEGEDMMAVGSSCNTFAPVLCVGYTIYSCQKHKMSTWLVHMESRGSASVPSGARSLHPVSPASLVEGQPCTGASGFHLYFALLSTAPQGLPCTWVWELPRTAQEGANNYLPYKLNRETPNMMDGYPGLSWSSPFLRSYL